MTKSVSYVPYLMGGHDRGPRTDVMGSPDRGPRVDVMGGRDPARYQTRATRFAPRGSMSAKHAASFPKAA